MTYKANSICRSIWFGSRCIKNIWNYHITIWISGWLLKSQMIFQYCTSISCGWDLLEQLIRVPPLGKAHLCCSHLTRVFSLNIYLSGPCSCMIMWLWQETGMSGGSSGGIYTYEVSIGSRWLNKYSQPMWVKILLFVLIHSSNINWWPITQ